MLSFGDEFIYESYLLCHLCFTFLLKSKMTFIFIHDYYQGSEENNDHHTLTNWFFMLVLITFLWESTKEAPNN